MKNPINRKTFLLIAVLASMAVSVQAQNLVLNPGFETGTFSSWTQGGDLSFTGVGTTTVHSGTFSAFLGPLTAGTLSQSIATTAGQRYNVSFWLQCDVGTPNSFAASFAGVPVITTITNSGGFPYTQFSLNNILAPTNSSLLLFTFSNPPAFWHLDDVSVTAVPEPSTAALLGVMAAGALGLREWRKRKAA